ncbi:MAG: GC-type dockerin domain-anchored protein [Phycisphaerales bacterium]
MRMQIGIAALIATAGMSASALAQDSVSSSLGGLPGDALNPWSDNASAYVVDLAPLVTSGGHTFGAAPLLKSTQTDPAFFNNLGSSSTISTDLLTGVPFSRPNYSFWDVAGKGVNVELNIPGVAMSAPDSGSQFSVAWSEFGTSISGNSYNGMIGAIVNYDPNDPNRLYVDRRMAAVNSGGPNAVDSSQLGGVSVDANGNVYYRGDDFNVTGPNPIVGNNIFRTRLADRNGAVSNHISLGGTTDATDQIIINGGTVYVVPNNIPASTAGGNGLYAGVNFNGEYTYGASSGSTTAITNYFDTSGGQLGSGRGANGGAAVDALGIGAAHTFGQYAKDANNDTRTFNLWGVDATGALVGAKAWDVPATITDNDDAFSLTYTSFAEFTNYLGSTPFRGGVGNVAVGTDIDGNGLFAATIAENGLSNDFSTQIIVGRYNSTTDTTEFTFAGYIDQFNLFTQDAGKPIYDDAGVEIGQLVNLDAVTGGTPLGPSMSAPTIDAAGNVWFIGAVELYDRFPDGGSDFDGALLRAVLDPATFSYRLELVLENGTRIHGQNSNRDYVINFLGSATSAGGPNPGSLWSSNGSSTAWNNEDLSGSQPGDTRGNGGIVVSTSITYDVDGDGEFNNPTSANFDPLLPADEAYSVLMYIGYYADGPAPCPADLTGDDVLNFFDVSAFLSAFASQDPIADFTGDGVYNFFDVSAFLSAFAAGCP